MFSSITWDMEPIERHNIQRAKEVPTGLFVSCEKSSLLIKVVQRMLAKKFSTKAVSGPPQPPGICEIILQALHQPPTGVNFNASKELLQSYLNMVKESRPNFVFEKVPEVIDLEDETDDDSEVCVILDDSISNSDDVKNEKRVLTRPCIEIIELNEEGECCSNVKTSLSEKKDIEKRSEVKIQHEGKIVENCSYERESPTATSNENQCKNISLENNRACFRGVKRKNELEVVEIEDDEIILIDDSFQKPSPSKDCSIVNFKQCNKNKDTNEENRDSHRSTQSNWLCKPYQNFINIVDSSKETQGQDKAEAIKNSHCSAKKSKLSYKRVAHLVSPLTQKVTETAETNESSSGASNIYNPNANPQEKRTGLRPIVIDGNNVGVSHGKGLFSVEGLKICINYFEKRGHRQIKAFLPHYRMNRNTHNDLEKMNRQGTVVFTPSRKLDGVVVASYDDRYIVQYAAEVGGVIVTNDNYRDLLEENPNWKETINKRLLMFSWVDDFLMFPQDPLGRTGPTLDDFLKFPD